MNLLKKMFTILLVFVILLADFTPFAVYAADISQGASKGDLRLGTYKAANKNKIEIVKTDANGVSVKKTVTKKSTGTYNVEFSVKGPKTQVTTTTKLPVYVVFVMDRSYSMKSDSRWTNAEKAAIEISKQFSTLGVQMAAVGYSGGRTRSEKNGGDEKKLNDTVYIRKDFSSDAITDFGSYDPDYTHGGGTNMQAGLLVAQSLLQNKTGIKHIILLSDGVPTFYYDGEGYTKGPGNSDEDEKIAQVPGVVEITKAAATQVKNADITIHTIGYHLDKLTYKYGDLSENALAKDTLSSIASSQSTYHLVDSKDKTTDVSIELGNIKTDIMNLSVANNPSVTDGIGNKFKLSGSKTYGGEKTLTKNNYQVQDNSWQTLGNFDVQIDTTSPTGWYKTNNNFTLTYTHITKGKQTITVKDNPEVYWTQPAPYTIYHVELNNTSNVLKTETGTAELKSSVLVNQQSFTGYTYHSKSKNNIVIDTENNVAYVYYTRSNYNYTIKHVELNNPSNVFETETGNANYGASIPVNQKSFTGFTYVRKDKNNIVIDTENNTAYVYYTRNAYDYAIKHVELGNETNVFETETGRANFGASIPVNQKTFAGFTYVRKDKNNIVIDTENNIAYVYYTRNSYDYTIKHVELGNKNNVFETETGRANYQDEIEVVEKEFIGFTYDSKDKETIAIDTENNIAYVYYTRNSYDYTIKHVELGNETNVFETETGRANYQDEIEVVEKEFIGFTYDSKDKEIIVIDTENNIAYVYYTRNSYDYTIKHVELGNETNVFETETGRANYQDEIEVVEKEFIGFTYDSKDKEIIVIDTENNIAYVYYTRNAYDYTIKHVELGNENNVFETETGRANYQNEIEVVEKEFTGFTYDSKDKETIVIDTENNIAYVYYTRNAYDYRIKHVELGNENNVFETETGNANYQDEIKVVEKEFTGFTYDSKDKETIVIDTENNIAYVYYTRNTYSYIVEYYKENTEGEFELVKEDTTKYENVEYESEVTYEIKEYPGYNYDEEKTENIPTIVPANDDLVIRLYYKLNDGKAIVHYVVKTDNGYVSFNEYGKDEYGNKFPNFENVNLNDAILIGKLGTEFKTEYRKVDGYYLVGLYNGNILTNQNLENLKVETVTSKFEEEIKEYTYVYQAPYGDGGEIEPPKTNVESTNYYNYILLISGLYIVLKSYQLILEK